MRSVVADNDHIPRVILADVFTILSVYLLNMPNKYNEQNMFITHHWAFNWHVIINN